MPIKRVIEPARTTEQIERDLALTRARIDATLDAMQDKLKPASLARDAAKSIVGSATRKVGSVVKRLKGRGGDPDRREDLPLTRRVPDENASAAPSNGSVSTAIVLAADAASMIMRTRRKSAAKIRKTALTIGAAAGAAGIAGAIAAAAIHTSRKRAKAKASRKPKPVRAKASKTKSRKKAAASKRRSTKRGRSK